MKNKSLVILLFLLSVCVSAYGSQKREMRGAWIASVANIDWPSRQVVGDDEGQRLELIEILDSLRALHFNAVVFQVRPSADALYYSELEPYSSWLSGKQGERGNYDPLEFLVKEAHKRCIDVHVWLNPYRATHSFGKDDLSSSHIYWQHPDWFVMYGDKWYFDPGLDQTREWLVRVVRDIVHRYDIDAVHFDDYFYPYKVRGKKGFIDFPDDKTFRDHPRGFTDKDAWRRNNVNLVIEELQKAIKSEKSWVEFGISPFGVWRNASSDSQRGSQTQAGVQNYDDLYADILLWLEKGWIDYVVPQLYWEIGKKVADYEILAHWWAENSYGRNLYVGHYVSQLGNPKANVAWRTGNEVCRQLKLNENIEQIDGSVMYSTVPMLRNPQGLLDSLREHYYKYEALPPINRNLTCRMSLPVVDLRLQGHRLEWGYKQETVGHFHSDTTTYFVVYGFPLGMEVDFDDARWILGKTSECSFELDEPDRYETICVTAINRYKQESMPCILGR